MSETTIRINKFLSDQGICSRREADRLIEGGKILINGVPGVMGQKVSGDEEIIVNGVRITGRKEKEPVLLIVNKPRGIVCTTAKRDKDNIVDFINYPERIYPVGRLDKESEGLILMTNQGDIVNKILRGGNAHDKEYIVRVDKPLTAEFLSGMEEGVPILDTVTKRCIIRKTGEREFHIILTQGLNRQIRRMCEYFGYRVRNLKRIRIMNLTLGDIKTGEYRHITDKERRELMKKITDSTNLSYKEANDGRKKQTDEGTGKSSR